LNRIAESEDKAKTERETLSVILKEGELNSFN